MSKSGFTLKSVLFGLMLMVAWIPSLQQALVRNPSLTAIDLGYRQVGYEGAALLDRLLESGYRDGEREIIRVEPRSLIPRHLTDAVAAKDPLVARAMRYILEHSNSPIKVGNVAQHVSTTRRTLERRFRDVLDRSVMEEITRCRLDRLKRRLAESTEPIKILAPESGFNSARVLYETFVREEGVSPHRRIVRSVEKGLESLGLRDFLDLGRILFRGMLRTSDSMSMEGRPDDPELTAKKEIS